MIGDVSGIGLAYHIEGGDVLVMHKDMDFAGRIVAYIDRFVCQGDKLPR